VFNQSATDVDNYGFNEKFSPTKTLASICNSGGTTANNSDTQSLNSLLNILDLKLKIKQFLPTQAILLKYCLYLCKGLIINNPSKNMGCLLKKIKD
jgi:hypothetical protein